MKRLPLSKWLKTLKYAFMNVVTGEHKYPIYASFKVTSRCKLSCPFCDMWRKSEENRELETNEIFTILDNLASSSILAVSFEGGEPFLRDDMGSLLEYAKKKPFFTELTTSAAGIDFEKVKDCAKFLDLLHISIDEGHKNLYLLDRLSEFKCWIDGLGVQIVVRKKDLPSLEDKVIKIHEAGARAIIMPATHLDGTPDVYPDPDEFTTKLMRLTELFPKTIVTNQGYLDAINKDHGCNTSSIIIGPDATLYYPCRTLNIKATNLLRNGLMDFLSTDKAASLRKMGRQCTRRCGWYQYFATSSYYMPHNIRLSLRPFFNEIKFIK